MFCRNHSSEGLPLPLNRTPFSLLVNLLAFSPPCIQSTVRLSFISVAVFFSFFFFALVTGTDYVGLSSFLPLTLSVAKVNYGLPFQSREPLMWSARQGDQVGRKSTVCCLQNDSICHRCESVRCVRILLSLFSFSMSSIFFLKFLN